MTRPINLKSMPTPALVHYAATNKSALHYRAVGELHARGTREVFDGAAALCKGESAWERATGADILGQLGWSEDSFRESSIKILLLLLDDADSLVVYSAAVSLGHRRAVEGIARLIALKKHRKSLVRFGVVLGLSCQDAPEAIEALIELSRDRSTDVRNWATFALGTLTDVDDEALCAALLERINDRDGETRGEALLGLARRKHPQALEWVAKELQAKAPMAINLEAAELLRSQALLPYLLRLKNVAVESGAELNSYFMSCLEKAITACSHPGST